MSFSRFLTDTGIIKRLTTTVSSGRTIEAWTTTVEYTINACIQPVSEELVALGRGDFYNTYSIYFNIGTDIQAGDKFILEDSVEFIIQGVQDRQYGLRQNHIKTSAIKK